MTHTQTNGAGWPHRTLYRGGVVYSPADPRATALLVTGDRVGWLGADGDAPAADVVVDLAGGVVAPAFIDAHVHCTDTGLALLGLDLSGARSAQDVLDAVAARAATLPADAVVLGHGWDETTWPRQRPPDAAELDRAAGGRCVYLSQACMHSALASAALLAAAPRVRGAAGFDPSGWLRRGAHHVVREVATRAVSAAQRRAAQRATLRRAATLGIAAIHECGGPGTSGEDDFTGLLALGREGGLPRVFGYWGELGAAAKAKELGALGAGGDLYADGALGSQTAYLREAYRDATDGGCGHGYLTSEQVAAHLVDCVRHRVQGGFHAIGDAAIGTVLDGFAAAAAVVGVDRVRTGRHRVEHVELADRVAIGRLVEFGVVASMQPAFDRLWGGEQAMYAQRLGRSRSLASNPFAAMAGVGVALAFGSDSPVTPLDPWGGVLAAMTHHNPAHRLGARRAFAAHTRGGWRAAHVDEEGVLVPGGPATFAVWRCAEVTGGLPSLAAGAPLPVCRRTVVRGEVIFDGDG